MREGEIEVFRSAELDDMHPRVTWLYKQMWPQTHRSLFLRSDGDLESP